MSFEQFKNPDDPIEGSPKEKNVVLRTMTYAIWHLRAARKRLYAIDYIDHPDHSRRNEYVPMRGRIIDALGLAKDFQRAVELDKRLTQSLLEQEGDIKVESEPMGPNPMRDPHVGNLYAGTMIMLLRSVSLELNIIRKVINDIDILTCNDMAAPGPIGSKEIDQLQKKINAAMEDAGKIMGK